MKSTNKSIFLILFEINCLKRYITPLRFSYICLSFLSILINFFAKKNILLLYLINIFFSLISILFAISSNIIPIIYFYGIVFKDISYEIMLLPIKTYKVLLFHIISSVITIISNYLIIVTSIFLFKKNNILTLLQNYNLSTKTIITIFILVVINIIFFQIVWSLAISIGMNNQNNVFISILISFLAFMFFPVLLTFTMFAIYQNNIFLLTSYAIIYSSSIIIYFYLANNMLSYKLNLS